MQKTPKKPKNNRLIALKRSILKSTARRYGLPAKHFRWSNELLQKQAKNRHWAPIAGVQAVLRNE